LNFVIADYEIGWEGIIGYEQKRKRRTAKAVKRAA
jgi:hypothetical protein